MDNRTQVYGLPITHMLVHKITQHGKKIGAWIVIFIRGIVSPIRFAKTINFWSLVWNRLPVHDRANQEWN